MIGGLGIEISMKNKRNNREACIVFTIDNPENVYQNPHNTNWEHYCQTCKLRWVEKKVVKTKHDIEVAVSKPPKANATSYENSYGLAR